MKITALYAGPLAFLYIAMALNVVKLRWKHRVSLGTGDIPNLERVIRAHGNFMEYVPFTLLLMGFSEFLGASAPLLHVFGMALWGARLAHTYCFCIKYHMILRQIGATISLLILAASALSGFFLALT